MLSEPIRPLLPGFPDWVAQGRLIPRISLPKELPVKHYVWKDHLILNREFEGPLLVQLPHLPILRSVAVGIFDGVGIVVHETQKEAEAPEGFNWVGLRSLFSELESGHVALAGRAFQLLEWDRSHQFCGRCGNPTVARDDERARVCPSCAHTAYPRISPVVMGLVVRGDEFLLARSPHFAPGVYSAVAGFVEAGESLEQALKREILEETAIHADNFRYFDSQPWPFPHSLMVAYIADYVSGTPLPQPGEIEDVQWFRVSELPKLPPPISVAGRLIRSVAAHFESAKP